MRLPKVRVVDAGICTAAVLALVVLAGGCGLGLNRHDGLELELRLDRRTIEAGDTLSGRLIVRNLTGRHRSLVFPTTAQYFITAYDALSRTAFGYPVVAGDAVTYLELEPRGSHTYDFSFAARCCETGRAVRPGLYRLVARLDPIDRGSPTAGTVILVR